MDLRQMSLIDAPVKNVSDFKMSQYVLGEDRLRGLESILEATKDADYWDPTLQAWLPILRMYLSSGANPMLAKKYLADLDAKPSDIFPGENGGTKIFSDILKLRRSSVTPVFTDVLYSDIDNFCEVFCKFFVGSRRLINKRLYSPEIVQEMMDQLLKRNTHNDLMRALYLYRHHQVDDFTWPNIITMEMQSRLGAWLEAYLFSFDDVYSFLGGDTTVYDWYQPKVREVMQRVWSTALQVNGRPDVLSNADVYAVTPKVAKDLVREVHASPAVYDNPLDGTAVWDCIYPMFYDNNIEDPAWCSRIFMAPCVPKSYLKRMCDILYEFLWLVNDKQLTTKLYVRKQVEYTAGDVSYSEMAGYLDILYSRGFPKIDPTPGV